MRVPDAYLRAPHFAQVGSEPVFIGAGTEELRCACGSSVLARAYRPHSLLAIAIACAQCGDVTTTPGLPDGEVLPRGVRVVTRERMPVSTSIVLDPDTVLADRDELVRIDTLTQPQTPPSETMTLSAATLDAAEAEYDRLTGGRLAADRAAVEAGSADLAAGLPPLPLAWAFGRLRAGVERPGWWCLAEEPDAVAAILLAAFREFIAVWSRHPLFDVMAASAAAEGFSTHALAPFAAARALAEAGNRVGFTRPPEGQTRMVGFHIDVDPTIRLDVLVRPLDLFDWPRGQGPQPAAVRAQAIDTLIASQNRINPRHPGVLVLSVGPVHRQADPVLMQGVSAALQGRWRRHRGLAGVALLLPKIYPTTRAELATFGWTFLPAANPHHPGAVMGLAPGVGERTLPT